MDILCNRDIDTFKLRVNGARAEVAGLMTGYKNSTGEVKEAYRKVINDKLWKFSKMTGEFYHKTIDAVLTLQSALGTLEAPSDILSARLTSDPSQ
jgi:hypothetical protein